jgi:hypothetical protein
MLKYWCSLQEVTQHLKHRLQKPHWLTVASQPENTLKYITSVDPVAAIDRSSSVRSGIGLGFGLALVLVCSIHRSVGQVRS